MSTVTDTVTNTLLSTPTSTLLRPRYEGSNICTWIGFKHVNYLVEEAVLEHFRRADLPSRRLYEEYGLGLDMVDLDTRILNAFHLDDVGLAEVAAAAPADRAERDDPAELSFAVAIAREGRPGKDVIATARVVLRRDTYIDPTDRVPAELARFVVDRIGGGAGEPVSGGEPVLDRLGAGSNVFTCKRRIPYPYCHFNERMQMSGYLRQMEEVVDLFLADRSISIRHLLDSRRWIPVVPHSRIRILDEVLLEEDLYTVVTVEEIFKDVTFRMRVDTFVIREGRLLQTSTGTITHGYAVVENRRDWRLVKLDDEVLNALRGGGGGR